MKTLNVVLNYAGAVLFASGIAVIVTAVVFSVAAIVANAGM